MNEVVNKIVENIEAAVIGKHKSVQLVVLSLLCSGHILLEDVPGVGKTTLATALARSLNGEFRRVQFTPDILPSDVTGYVVYDKNSGDFTFKKGAAFCNILLADEINRASPRAQSSLLEAMQEKQVTVDSKTYLLPDPFLVIATQNPVEQLGTYPLPEAQLDRFFMRISLGYPQHSDELFLAGGGNNSSSNLQPVANISDILTIREEIKNIFVSNEILNYVIDIVNATRNDSRIKLGISPRGTIALVTAAKANAFCRARDYCIPSDVQQLILPVFSHRLVMSAKSFSGNVQTSDDVLKEIFSKMALG